MKLLTFFLGFFVLSGQVGAHVMETHNHTGQTDDDSSGSIKDRTFLVSTQVFLLQTNNSDIEAPIKAIK